MMIEIKKRKLKSKKWKRNVLLETTTAAGVGLFWKRHSHARCGRNMFKN